MRNRTGPPVTGDDFFGRRKELDYAWQLLLDGNNLMLPSPRRVGKTSFALALMNRAKKENWETIHINLEQSPDEFRFLEQLIEQLKKLSVLHRMRDAGSGLIELMGRIKAKMEVGEVTLGLEWEANKRDVYKEIAKLLDHSQSTLVFFDEVAVLLGHIGSSEKPGRGAGEFLHWLRSLRIEPDSKIRWIFCSSVGIENFTRMHRLSETINDFKSLDLKAFSTEESLEMLERLGADNAFELPLDVRIRVVERLVYGLPFFIQLMFEQMKNLHFTHGKEIKPDLANEAFELLSEGRHFNTWIERIEKQYDRLSTPAFLLLKAIAQHPAGCSRLVLKNTLLRLNADLNDIDNQLGMLLQMLRHDGYLLEAENKFDFRSPLLKAFWLKNLA